jgi:uncharacterized protein (TIGR03118 family)
VALAAAAGLLAYGGPGLASAATAASAKVPAKTLPVKAAAARAAANSFHRVNLIANRASFGAKLVDPNLVNAWGLAAGPGAPLWVSDNNSGFASVYSGGAGGGAVTLDLTVRVPGGNPTGQVFNPDSKAFPVGGTAGLPAIFIVDTDSIGPVQSPGEIAAWDGSGSFVAEDSPKGGPGGKVASGAVFKGLALATSPKAGPELFAADVHNARVDVFNRNFAPLKAAGEFSDPKIPAGYAPFGIQNLGGKIYVTYGKQNTAKNDVVTGNGLGFVDVYSVNGVLLHHLVSAGRTSPLDAPWGLVIAPKGFGPFGGDLLVGNLGNGWVNAFNPTTGAFLGTLDSPIGYPVTISGLWGLRAGSSAFGGTGSVVFSAGPGGYANGVVGTLTPAG